MIGRHGRSFGTDRSHVEASNRLRGNASKDALRLLLGRGASRAAFPRGAWERSWSVVKSMFRSAAN
ncbi:hypothetical protein DBV33_08600 [Pseudomonas fluorescens]|nr:hypothetical protein DBV33_08600 [Pseudomonas fluorescens]